MSTAVSSSNTNRALESQECWFPSLSVFLAPNFGVWACVEKNDCMDMA